MNHWPCQWFSTYKKRPARQLIGRGVQFAVCYPSNRNCAVVHNETISHIQRAISQAASKAIYNRADIPVRQRWPYTISYIHPQPDGRTSPYSPTFPVLVGSCKIAPAWFGPPYHHKLCVVLSIFGRRCPIILRPPLLLHGWDRDAAT